MSVFRYLDRDGDQVEIMGGTGSEADRLTMWISSKNGANRYVYLSTQAVDDMIDALQGWRGLRPQDVPTAETPAAVGTCLHCPHSPLTHSRGLGCRMCGCELSEAEAWTGPTETGPAETPVATCVLCPHSPQTHSPAGGCRMCACALYGADVTDPDQETEPEAVQTAPTMVQQLRAESLALAVQLHSRSPFEHDSGDHALDTAEEFSRWLLDGTRDRPAEPVTITPGLKIPLQATLDPLCLICRHAHHGAMHCGERNTSAGDRTRCKCTGVAQA